MRILTTLERDTNYVARITLYALLPSKQEGHRIFDRTFGALMNASSGARPALGGAMPAINLVNPIEQLVTALAWLLLQGHLPPA